MSKVEAIEIKQDRASGDSVCITDRQPQYTSRRLRVWLLVEELDEPVLAFYQIYPQPLLRRRVVIGDLFERAGNRSFRVRLEHTVTVDVPQGSTCVDSRLTQQRTQPARPALVDLNRSECRGGCSTDLRVVHVAVFPAPLVSRGARRPDVSSNPIRRGAVLRVRMPENEFSTSSLLVLADEVCTDGMTCSPRDGAVNLLVLADEVCTDGMACSPRDGAVNLLVLADEVCTDSSDQTTLGIACCHRHTVSRAPGRGKGGDSDERWCV